MAAICITSVTRVSLIRHACISVGAFACLTLANIAVAQTYPSTLIRLIVPNPPAGAGDTIGRLVANGLSKRLGQQTIVENRGGGNGAIGLLAAINAPPDGYTLVLGNGSNMAIDPTQQKISYRPRDLLAVAPLITIPFVVVANPAFPPNNIRELIAAAKREPGKINFASAGSGGAAHLASELIIALGKVEMVHVPYKGAAPAFLDVVAGRVPFMTGDVNSALPFLKSGRLKALAVTGTERMSLLPDVPTVAESGLPGYEAGNWFGIFAPAKTPAAIVATLFNAAEAFVQEAEFKARIASLGGRVMVMSRIEFERFVAAETVKRTELIKSNKIVLDSSQ
jgi:tripartite-type tricarboxylate transporter receptor subunit TctC